MTSAPAAPSAGRAAREPLSGSDWLVTAPFANLVIGGAGLTSVRGHPPSLQEQAGGLRAEMKEDLGGLRAEMKPAFGEMGQIGGMRRDIQPLSGRMRAVEERLGGIETVLRIHHGPLPRP